MAIIHFADFHLTDHGSVRVLTAVTDEAQAWAAEHLPGDAQQWVGGVVIAPRHLDGFLADINRAGLRVVARW